MMTKSVTELAYKYNSALIASKTHGSEWEYDDFTPIRDYVHAKFSDDEFIILHAYEMWKAEFTRGHRCSVCGMTDAQSKAIGYNCSEEC